MTVHSNRNAIYGISGNNVNDCNFVKHLYYDPQIVLHNILTVTLFPQIYACTLIYKIYELHLFI